MSAGPPQPSQNSLEFVFSRFYGILPMLTSPQESGINHELIRRRGQQQQQQQQQQQAEAGPSNASASRNQDPVNGGEQAEGPSAPSVDVCILVTHLLLLLLPRGLRSLPIPIILIAKVKFRSEGSVKCQKQLWRSRKRPQRRGREGITTMTTSVTTMGTSTPPCRSRSRQTSQATPSRLSEASRNAPNARNNSPWCVLSAIMSPAFLFMIGEDQVHDGCRPSAWLSLPPLC